MMFDVIIVGGGVAGSFLASKLDGKCDVLVLEQSKKIIEKDSGIVSCRFDELMGKDAEKLIKTHIRKMDLVSPSGLTCSLQSGKPFARILKREAFAKSLRKNAKKKANISYERVENLAFEKNQVIVATKDSCYKSRMVVGCDGANSIVRRCMKIAAPALATGLMVKTRQKLEGNTTVHMNKYFSPDFFSWVIPQSSEYGLMTAVRPMEYFNYFVKNMYLPAGKVHAFSIPYTSTKSYSDRGILIGDSCGQNKPLTGGGIVFSMIAAQKAAIIINDAVRTGRYDRHFLAFYEKYWKKEFASEIRKQLMIRKIYRTITNSEIDELFKKFGPALASVYEFDYDKLSTLSSKISRIDMARFLMPKLPGIIRELA